MSPTSMFDLNQLIFRQMREVDLPSVMQIQASAYASDFQESQAVFLRKLHLAPDFCWVAQVQDQVVGYLFSHPWQDVLPPALHAPLDALPEFASCWFVHDMAFLPQARGLGLAKRLYAAARNKVNDLNLSKSMLVAMPGVSDFWLRCGYQIVENLSDQLHQKMSQYGGGARLMWSECLK